MLLTEQTGFVNTDFHFQSVFRNKQILINAFNERKLFTGNFKNLKNQQRVQMNQFMQINKLYNKLQDIKVKQIPKRLLQEYWKFKQ